MAVGLPPPSRVMARGKARAGLFTAILTRGSKNVCDFKRKEDCAQVGAKSFAMKPLAELVLEHRLSLGMNPAQYARHVGTSRQNINNVEAGEAQQPRYIGKLAKAMGASVDALLAGQGRIRPEHCDLGRMRPPP